MPALLAPPRENFASALRAHTLQKAVHALTTPVVRLIRPLHVKSSLTTKTKNSQAEAVARRPTAPDYSQPPARASSRAACDFRQRVMRLAALLGASRRRPEAPRMYLGVRSVAFGLAMAA